MRTDPLGSLKCSQTRSFEGLLRLALIVLLGAVSDQGAEAAPQRPQAKEYSIMIDATALNPPTWWYVPGVTPIIWSMEPDNTEALRTTSPHELKLKAGNYRFGTFTFDFPFTVTLDGTLDFAPSLDQCVTGRGTNALAIQCSRTQPYGGQPEYWGQQSPK